MNIDGTVALVGGGGSGLSRATEEALKGRGTQVVILDLPASEGKAEGSTSEARKA